MGLPDPLDPNIDSIRRLSDRGIRQALADGLITITPPLDPADGTRIQPASLDVCIAQVAPDGLESLFSADEDEFDAPQKPGYVTIPALTKARVWLTEEIDVRPWEKKSNIGFFTPVVEARSSMHRLGQSTPPYAGYFTSVNGHTEIMLTNYWSGDIDIPIGERVAQVFFEVHPHSDLYSNSAYDRKLGERVRKLDMGIELTTGDEIREAARQGLFDLSPSVEINERGYVLLHAADTARRLKDIPLVDFGRRAEHAKDFEEIDITNGYTTKRGEHLLIDVRERIMLSPYIGMQVYDNTCGLGYDEHMREAFNRGLSALDEGELTDDLLMLAIGGEFAWIPDSWGDPGYSGVFSRQPKFPGRTFRPGDVLGAARLFHYPNGVEFPYGSKRLGSQYQNTKKVELGKHA